MDYKEEIKKAGKVYWENNNANEFAESISIAFINGALSDEARNYWIDLVIKELTMPTKENDFLIRLYNFKNKVDSK